MNRAEIKRLIGFGRTKQRVSERTHVLDIGGREIPLRVRRNPRARRLTLRIDPIEGGAIVTVPSATSADEGVRFAKRKSDWLLSRLDKVPPRNRFEDGTTIRVLDREYVVRHAPGMRGVVKCESGEIKVTGRPEHLSRRLTDWLKREARCEFTERAGLMAATLGMELGRISVRDTRSRWGSCSANGNLSFCWRLIMAPEFVLGYVVAHEIAHLVEKNHGPEFWMLVAHLSNDAERAKTWLRIHGEALHRMG